jgi:hypothetical protein
MKKRLIVLATVAIILVSGATVAAVTLPGACPSSFHSYSATSCVSDATHIAPSSGVRIPVAMAPLDRRLALRLEIVVVAMLIAGGVLWLGSTAIRRPADPVPHLTLSA